MIYILNVGQHPPTGKAATLVGLHGATRITEPFLFTEVPEGQRLICVIENAFFDAAAVVTTAEEFRICKYDDGGRPRTWLLMDRATVLGMVTDWERAWLTNAN